MGISSSDAVTVGMTPTALGGWPSLEGADCVLEEQFYREFCPIRTALVTAGTVTETLHNFHVFFCVLLAG